MGTANWLVQHQQQISHRLTSPTSLLPLRDALRDSDFMLSDNGQQFSSNVFISLWYHPVINNTRRAAYHLQTNVQVERYKRTSVSRRWLCVTDTRGPPYRELDCRSPTLEDVRIMFFDVTSPTIEDVPIVSLTVRHQQSKKFGHIRPAVDICVRMLATSFYKCPAIFPDAYATTNCPSNDW